MSPWIGNLSVDVNTRCRNVVGNSINEALSSSEQVTHSVSAGVAHWATEEDDTPEFCGAGDLVYDDSIMARSLVQDFSLVCDRAGLRTLVNISYMMGEQTLTLITSPDGPCQDCWWRRPCLAGYLTPGAGCGPSASACCWSACLAPGGRSAGQPGLACWGRLGGWWSTR